MLCVTRLFSFMPQQVPPQPRRTSDQKWVMRLIAIAVFLVVCFFAVGFFVTRHWEQDAQERAKQAELETYLQSTKADERAQAQMATQPPPSPGPTPAQQVRAKLVAHPHVIPGPGFDRPGVQATAIVIVDAIDEAQSRQNKMQ